jgi:hypothetical protein
LPKTVQGKHATELKDQQWERRRRVDRRRLNEDIIQARKKKSRQVGQEPGDPGATPKGDILV